MNDDIWRHHPTELGDDLVERFTFAQAISPAELGEARARREPWRHELAEVLGAVGVHRPAGHGPLPGAPGRPGAVAPNPAAPAVSLSGHPALVLPDPVGRAAAGQPPAGRPPTTTSPGCWPPRRRSRRRSPPVTSGADCPGARGSAWHAETRTCSRFAVIGATRSPATGDRVQDLGSGKTTERPVRLGGALVTIVEPHRGHEVAYNRWYERDHFYAGCMIGAWNISGARFVATRDLKALRYPADSPVIPDPTTGSLPGPLLGARRRVRPVDAVGERSRCSGSTSTTGCSTERDHVHTLMYKFRTEFEEPDGVPVELALDHRSPYVVVVIGEPAEGTSLDDVDAWFRSPAAPRRGRRRAHRHPAARPTPPRA